MASPHWRRRTSISSPLLDHRCWEKTKFSKTFATFFFPVGDEVRAVVREWILYLRENKLWGNDDPLFPATRIAVGASRQFGVGPGTQTLEQCLPHPSDLPRCVREGGPAVLSSAQLQAYAGPSWKCPKL